MPKAKLPAYAWPGGYPILYATDEGCVLCHKCATSDDAHFIHYEGEPLHCEECNKITDSAYGLPESNA